MTRAWQALEAPGLAWQRDACLRHAGFYNVVMHRLPLLAQQQWQ